MYKKDNPKDLFTKDELFLFGWFSDFLLKYLEEYKNVKIDKSVNLDIQIKDSKIKLKYNNLVFVFNSKTFEEVYKINYFALDNNIYCSSDNKVKFKSNKQISLKEYKEILLNFFGISLDYLSTRKMF